MSKALDEAMTLTVGKKITLEIIDKLLELREKIEPEEELYFSMIMEGAYLDAEYA